MEYGSLANSMQEFLDVQMPILTADGNVLPDGVGLYQYDGETLLAFPVHVLIIGVILYKENISNIISAIRKITQIPIIILTDTSSLLCMSWKKELIYAGADCVMDINSTTEEVDLQIFSLARRNNKQKITQKQSETMINKGKLVMDHKKHKVFWNNVALHLTRQEYNFLLI